jgi:short-subunit dehydrogenase
MKPLRGTTALLTGASKGIGVYIARALAKEGMDLVLAARSAEDLEKVASELRSGGQRVLAVPTDLGDRGQLENLVERAEGEFGGIDVLVNNAGLEETFPYIGLSSERIDQIMEVNLRAPMILSHALLPKMIERGRGHIVNVASVAGLAGVPYSEPYSASKHGLIGFSRSLFATAIGEGYPVGVTAVCPGFVADAGMYEEGRVELGIEAPAALGTSPAEDVASAVVRGIVEEKPEIIVTSMPIRPALVAQVFSPRLALWLMTKLGGMAFFKQTADRRVEDAASQDPADRG